MVRFDTLLKRLRNRAEAKSYVRIQTVDACETMTATQACRFRELQSNRFDETAERRRVKSHYSLKEAARLLRTEVDDILASASAGRLQCFVRSEGLRGHWRTTEDGKPRLRGHPTEMPKYLALTPADCRQLAAYGSVNVHDLDYPAGSAPEGNAILTGTRFILREPVWIDRAGIVLKHPLPK